MLKNEKFDQLIVTISEPKVRPTFADTSAILDSDKLNFDHVTIVTISGPKVRPTFADTSAILDSDQLDFDHVTIFVTH